MEIKIVLDKRLLDNKDYDFFHYGNSYKLAECEYGDFYIASRGELKCSYVDKNNEIITENYYNIINYYIKNNEEYQKAVDNGSLILDLNNWFEIEFYTKAEEDIRREYICLTDEIFGSISEGLTMFKEYIKDEKVVKEFEEDIKEVINNESII